jgi:hypothetical protein
MTQAAVDGRSVGLSPAKLLETEEKNQITFVETLIELRGMPGSGPFDLTLNESVAYFPTLFLLYAAFHELGHLTQRHSTDQRKLEEEVSCDFFALFAVRHLFNLAGFRVPFEVGAAAMFYGVLEHVSMVDKMQKIDRNERPDAQFYNLSPDNFVDTSRVLKNVEFGCALAPTVIIARWRASSAVI